MARSFDTSAFFASIEDTFVLIVDMLFLLG
jgi:hypothetical protein